MKDAVQSRTEQHRRLQYESCLNMVQSSDQIRVGFGREENWRIMAKPRSKGLGLPTNSSHKVPSPVIKPGSIVVRNENPHTLHQPYRVSLKEYQKHGS